MKIIRLKFVMKSKIETVITVCVIYQVQGKQLRNSVADKHRKGKMK